MSCLEFVVLYVYISEIGKSAVWGISEKFFVLQSSGNCSFLRPYR